MLPRVPPFFFYPVALLGANFVALFPAADAFAFPATYKRITTVCPARPRSPTPPQSSAITRQHVHLSLSSSPDDNLSASSRERRNEDLRRLSRRDDVVVGKTSARPDAKDYSLDPGETERQWAAQANDVEREINAQTERGMQALKMLDLDGANDAFDKVYQLKPSAYLWQAGVVKYYRNELVDAAKCFAENAATFESKFMSPASEERIWRDACELKAASNGRIRTRGKRKGEGEDGAAVAMYRDIVKYAPTVAHTEENDGGASVPRETRKVLRIARDLFQGSIGNDASAVALNRAKLRSICGEHGSPPTVDRKKWKLSSWYYLGLHYDAMGDVDDARACMKMALRQGASSGNGEDIINMLPFLHMTVRDWFDDDEFSLEDEVRDDDDDGILGGEAASIWDEEEPNAYAWSSRNGGNSGDGNGGKTVMEESVADNADIAGNEFQPIRSTNSKNAAAAAKDSDNGGARSVVKVAIEASLAKVRLTELKESLRKRGMKTSGSKAELQERLLSALLEDAGF